MAAATSAAVDNEWTQPHSLLPLTEDDNMELTTFLKQWNTFYVEFVWTHWYYSPKTPTPENSAINAASNNDADQPCHTQSPTNAVMLKTIHQPDPVLPESIALIPTTSTKTQNLSP